MLEFKSELDLDSADIAAIRIPQDPPVENCELRPYVLLRDINGNQSADMNEDLLSFTWSAGQKRICSVPRCNGGAKLQCMQCLKLKRNAHSTFFCSSEHLQQAWPAHQKIHQKHLKENVQSYEWHADDNEDENCVSSDDPALLACRYPPPIANIWTPVSAEKIYIPRGDDVGRMLRVEVSLGDVVGFRETSSVLPEPEAPPPRKMIYANDMRPKSGTFTVFSYNILADMYATRRKYPYCPLWALLWTYRRNNILRELLSCRADIISLQEVQLDHFDEFLYPRLKEVGYEGLFKKKTRQVLGDNPKQMDGCAIFYREDKFALMEQYSIEYNEAARQHVEECMRRKFRNAHRSAAANEYRSEALKRMLKGNVALVLVLEELGCDASRRQRRRKRRLCVANTHVFWDPMYSDVKLWQTLVLCDQLEKLVLSRNLPLIICGDLNSTLESAVYYYLLNRRVPADHPIFTHDPCEILPPPNSMVHRLPLLSSYGEVTGEPQYTNYTGDFVGCLDYIWFTNIHLRVAGVLQEDEEAVLQEYTALPSPRYPSDHISLKAEFEWI